MVLPNPIFRFNIFLLNVKNVSKTEAESPSCLSIMSINREDSAIMSGSRSIPLSVPNAMSAPISTMRESGGTFPKYMFDPGQTTIGTSASAHFSMSESSASHI